jgi:hypothetical protein
MADRVEVVGAALAALALVPGMTDDALAALRRKAAALPRREDRMDPNANLAAQRKLAARILACVDREEAPDPEDVRRLAELVEALDDWLKMGGALPDDWLLEHANRRAR